MSGHRWCWRAVLGVLGPDRLEGMTSAKRPDRRPPYQHAADELRREILAGQYKAGDQLPSYRELQERFGIANMTARSALGVLRDEGLIETIQGRGSFVTNYDGFAANYTPPAWYMKNWPQSVEITPGPNAEGEAQPSLTGSGLVELVASLRDEIKKLAAEHQELRREVEELKGRHPDA